MIKLIAGYGIDMVIFLGGHIDTTFPIYQNSLYRSLRPVFPVPSGLPASCQDLGGNLPLPRKVPQTGCPFCFQSIV